MSSMGSGEESLSLADFAESVIADIEGQGSADTASAPAETANTSTTETDDTAEAPEATEDATGRLHGKDGKFVEKPSSEDDETDEEPADDSEGEELEDEEADDSDDGLVIEVDDEETAARLQTYLEKYDGDVTKALIAATEAQSLVGRKAEDIAGEELRALRAELEQVRAGQERTLAQLRTPMIPITRELIENDPASAAQQAVAQDNAPALEAAISVWREENPEAADFFLRTVVLEAQLAEATAAAAAPQTTEQSTEDAEVDAEVQKVLQKHPDLEQHLPAIGKAADENPLLKRAMETGSPQERAQALEALTVIAKASSAADTSREAMKRVQVRVKQEADDARKNARVVSASRGSAASASQPTRVDQFLQAFDARLGLKVNED